MCESVCLLVTGSTLTQADLDPNLIGNNLCIIVTVSSFAICRSVTSYIVECECRVDCYRVRWCCKNFWSLVKICFL